MKITSIKRLSWGAFARLPNGTRVNNYDYDQCVAVVNLYHEGVRRLPHIPISSAVELWTRRKLLPELRNHYRPGLLPVKGAIAVWDAGPANGWKGHTGVVTHVYRDGRFNTREQNWGTGSLRWMRRYRRHSSDEALLGFLAPVKVGR